MSAQKDDILYAERLSIPGKVTAQEIASLNKSWIELKASTIIEPILVGSTSDGEVYRLNNGVIDYYDQRSDDVTKQAFYRNWDGIILSDLIVSRIINNI